MRYVLALAAILAICIPTAASDLIPSVTNPGFEDGTAAWAWQVIGGTQASFAVSTSNPHSGKSCLVFSNNSGIAANVYGRFSTNVNVIPSAKYELSCWVRGVEVGSGAGSSHLTDWQSYMLDFPTGTFGWRRISTVFTTKPGQNGINIGINITNACKELAIDDVDLRPLGGQLQGDGISGIILTNPTVIGHGSPVSVCVMLDNTSKSASAVESAVSISGKKVAKHRDAIKPGRNTINWQWNTGSTPYGK